MMLLLGVVVWWTALTQSHHQGSGVGARADREAVACVVWWSEERRGPWSGKVGLSVCAALGRLSLPQALKVVSPV